MRKEEEEKEGKRHAVFEENRYHLSEGRRLYEASKQAGMKKRRENSESENGRERKARKIYKHI